MPLKGTIRFILITLICLGTLTSTQAQVYDFVVHNRESGIVGTHINDIAQDEQGYLWVATNSGVSRFDGKTFINYHEREGLGENICSSIFCDNEGNIWVGHQSAGVSIISSDSIKTLSEKDGLANNEVHDIFQDKDGKIWIATFGGVSVLEDENWSLITKADGLASNNVRAITQDVDGKMWMGTYGAGINILDESKTEHLHRGNGLINNYVTSFGLSGNDVLIGTLGGLSAWNGNSFVNVPGSNQLSNNQVNDVAIGSTSQIWIGTFSGINRLGATPISLSELNGLPENEIHATFIDAENNVWLGTNSGLIRIKNLAFEHHFSTEDLDVYPSSLFVDSKGQFWAGNEAGGVLSYNGTRFVSAFEDPDINDHQISSIAEDADGNLWFGTMDFGGLFQWDGEKFYIYSDEFGLADNNINCLVSDNDGILYIGTPNGLSTFDGMDFQIVFLSDDFATNHVTALEKNDDGSILIGSSDGALFRYTEGEARKLHQPQISTRITDITSSNLGVAFAAKDGGVWVDRNGAIEHISEENGLHNSDVHSLAFHNEHLFVGTGTGLEQIFFEADSFRLEKHDRAHGFLGGSCKNDGMLSVNEDVFIGTEKGMVILNPRELKPDNKAPKTALTELQLSYETVDWSSLGYQVLPNGMPANLNLSYTDNNLRFFFSGINHSYPEQVTYKWKLEGYEAEWTPYSNEVKASYPSLSPGDYTFKLVACNSNGICSEEPIEYSFSINPPFWQTWWFLTLLFIAITLGTFLYVKQREKRLLEEKQILESTVEERTKELREQKEIVEHQNQHITESIEYASNIQKAILPSEEEMNSAFNGHFVFYRPKDVVGGDFYWAYHENDISWAAAVDCTGHGVSGAFMSMIGSDLLNQIIIEKKISDPARVLEEMDKGIKLAFAQSAKEFESDQGMDVTLIRIDRKKNSLLFAGAQRPLFIFVDGELTEIEGDRYSISCADEIAKDFTNHEVSYTENAMTYLFSDGITDQFGGPKGKKFMLRRVREFLVENHANEMEIQHNTLIKTFDDWRGKDNNQLDDVMLMAIRL